MRDLVFLVRLAGAVQLGIAAVNFVLPSILDYRGNLSRVSRMVSQIFVVHSAYIVLVLVLFGLLCLVHADVVVTSPGVGRFLAWSLAVFWMPRPFIQWFYYDRSVTGRFPLLNALFQVALVFLAVVFLVSALATRDAS